MDDDRLAVIDGGEYWIGLGCDPEVAEALRSFARELTPSHSLTSRHYSVWSLVTKHVDAPLNTYLEHHHRLAYRDGYLKGFRLSRVGHTPPCWIPKRVGGYEWVPVPGHLPTSCPGGTPEIEWQCDNCRQWYENILAVVHAVRLLIPPALPLAAMESPAGNPPPLESGLGRGTLHDSCVLRGSHDLTPTTRFVATLVAINALLASCTWFRPKVGRNNDRKRGAHQPRWESERIPDDKTRARPFTTCELCWRPTRRWGRLASWEPADDPYSRIQRYSDRFCYVHQPGKPGSDYQADIRYQELFRHELVAMKRCGRPASLADFAGKQPVSELYGHAYALSLKSPWEALSINRARKAAYDQVHAFPIRPLRPRFSDLSFVERVFLLHDDGLRNVDVAKRLGVTKQAVGRVMKKLRGLEQARKNECNIYPDTHEAFTFADESGQRLLDAVAKLRSEGATTAQIAHELHYFKHTIKAVYRFLSSV